MTPPMQTRRRLSTAATAAPGCGSFFSCEAFLGAIASSHFPGKPWKAETVIVAGRAFRVLNVNGHVIDKLWTHPFFYEPLPEIAAGARPHPYLALVAVDTIPAPMDNLPIPSRLAPFIDWRPFRKWDEYLVAAHQGPHPAMWKTGAYKSRRLGRNLGEVVFAPHDPAPDVLPALFTWKDAKRLRTGISPVFCHAAVRALYEQLLAAGHLQVSTLRAAGRLLSGILGYLWDGRYYFRLIAHDVTLNAYSPGTVLLHAMLKHSYERGDAEFDFLMGAEPYKWMYATHARVLSAAGSEPVRTRLVRRLRRVIHKLRRSV
jgi:CelD/BcsL family acetyltransferase involved in cellulose biosynthesis